MPRNASCSVPFERLKDARVKQVCLEYVFGMWVSKKPKWCLTVVHPSLLKTDLEMTDRWISSQATELTIVVTVTYCVVSTTLPVTWIYTNQGRLPWRLVGNNLVQFGCFCYRWFLPPGGAPTPDVGWDVGGHKVFVADQISAPADFLTVPQTIGGQIGWCGPDVVVGWDSYHQRAHSSANTGRSKKVSANPPQLG